MSWSAGAGITGTPAFVVSSGTRIYWAHRGAGDLSDDVYEYNPGTDTATRIIQISAITDYFNTRGLAWFNGNLYVLAQYNIGTDSVYRVQRWTGVADGLTTVDTVVTEPTVDIGFANIYCDGSLMMVAYTPEIIGNHIVRYTNDGSSWSTGGFGSFNPRKVGNDATRDNPKLTTEYPLGIYDDFCTNSSGADCTEDRQMKFVSAAWTSIKVHTTSGHHYRQGSPNGGVHWVEQGSATFTPDFVTYTDASITITQVREINMPWMPGVEASSLYRFNGATFTLFESFGSLAFSSPDNTVMVRLDSNLLYYIAPEDVSGTWIVARSSIPLTGQCQFYQGTNIPTFKSNLPFEGVLPGAMAISPDGQTAVVGSNAAAEQMVVYAANPWASWIDMSSPMSTGSSVSAVRYV